MTHLAAITNIGIFAGTSLLGIEVLRMDGMVAVSFGFLLVMLKLSFELGRLVRRMEDWTRDMDSWKADMTKWKHDIDRNINSLACQQSNPGGKCKQQ